MTSRKKKKHDESGHEFLSTTVWKIVGLCFAVVGLVLLISYWKCRLDCQKNFQGPYPEIACKYECHLFPTRKTAVHTDIEP